MQLIPIGNSIIYVRPFYAQGRGEGSYPLFQFVVVYSQGYGAFCGPTVQDGLDQMLGRRDPVTTCNGVGRRAPGGTGTGSPTTTTTTHAGHDRDHHAAPTTTTVPPDDRDRRRTSSTRRPPSSTRRRHGARRRATSAPTSAWSNEARDAGEAGPAALRRA